MDLTIVVSISVVCVTVIVTAFMYLWFIRPRPPIRLVKQEIRDINQDLDRLISSAPPPEPQEPVTAKERYKHTNARLGTGTFSSAVGFRR